MNARVVTAAVVVAVLVCMAHAQSDWTRLKSSGFRAPVQFTVALRQRNLKQLEDTYWRLTDPRNPEYAKWKTLDEINAIVAPPAEARVRVVTWLAAHGVIDVDVHPDFIVAKTIVLVAERLFQQQFFQFQHTSKAWEITRFVGEYVLPEHIREVVQFVTGVNDFPVVHTPQMRAIDDAIPSTSYYVVPQTLRNIYNVSSAARATNKQSSQAAVEFGTQAGISYKDLSTFCEQAGSPLTNLSYTVGNFVTNPFNPVNGESTLDVQYITSMGVGAETSFWVINGWMYDFAVLVQQRSASKQPVPWVFSLSYGWAESQQCQVTGQGTTCLQLGGTSEDYVNRTNIELQKVGLLGITLIGISQDAGAASKWNALCNQNPPVNPEYPGASPFMFVLGATMLDPADGLTNNRPPFCTNANTPCAGGGTEIVCSVPVALITSGGGFSNYAARPSYQDAAVNAWAANKNALRPPANLYNANGRGYPDVATLGHQYMIVYNGAPTAVDGTSCSAPVFAGLATLLNDARFNAGKAPLGPLNTLFYQIGASAQYSKYFNDITIGNNTGTMTSGLYPHGCHIPYGYGAVVGWDPVTGLGTPNFGNLLDYIKSLSN